MADFKLKPSTKRKYTHPSLYLHYILLLAVLYYFGVDMYIKYINPMLTRFGFNLYGTVKILFWNPTLDAILMAVFFFIVLVVGDIVIHIFLGKATGWKD